MYPPAFVSLDLSTELSVQSLKFFPRVGSAALGTHSFADLYHICVLLDNNAFSQSKVVVPGRCPAPVSLQDVFFFFFVQHLKFNEL